MLVLMTGDGTYGVNIDTVVNKLGNICSMLTDSRNPVKMCRNCGRAFIAKRYLDKFCSKKCSDEYRQKE